MVEYPLLHRRICNKRNRVTTRDSEDSCASNMKSQSLKADEPVAGDYDQILSSSDQLMLHINTQLLTYEFKQRLQTVSEIPPTLSHRSV